MGKKFVDLANLKSNLENFFSEIISPTFVTKEAVTEQLGNHTVKSDVPENAVFTDTVYDYSALLGYDIYNLVSLKDATYPANTAWLSKDFIAPFDGYVFFMVQTDGASGEFSQVFKEDGVLLSDNQRSIADFNTWGEAYHYKIYKGKTYHFGSYTNTATAFNKVMLCIRKKLETPTEYVPYAPSNVALVEKTTNLDKRISDNGYGEVVGGKNLLNPNKFLKWVNQYTNGRCSNDEITISPVNVYLYNNFFKFSDTNIDVTLSIKSLTFENGSNPRVCLVNSAGTIIGTVTTDTPSASGLGCGIKIDFTDLPTSITIKELMIEEGSVATEYEPYFPSNKMLAEEKADKSETTVNLLNPTLQTTTSNGVTCTNNGDGTYTLNGTKTTDTIWLRLGTVSLKANTSYKLIGQSPIYGTTDVRIYDNDGVYFGDGTYKGATPIITPTTDISLSMQIRVAEITALDNFIVKPMITTNLDATYDNFVPYTGDTGRLNGDVAKLKNDVGDVQSTLTTVISDTANIRDDYVSKLYYTNRNTPYVTADENAIVATSTGSASMSPRLINETLAEIVVMGADINNIVFDEQLKCTGLSINIPDDGVTRYVYIETSTELQPYVKTGMFRLQQSTGSRVTIRNIDGYSYYETNRGLSGTIPIIIPQGTKLSGETYIFVYITDKLKTPLDERFMSLGQSTYKNIDNIKTTQNELNTILADINTYMGTISETSSDYKIGSYLQSVVQKLVDLSISK